MQVEIIFEIAWLRTLSGVFTTEGNRKPLGFIENGPLL